MKVYNIGILDTSDVYFHTGSALAQNMYFYLLCTGHYYCDGTYIVERQNYNSFLALYVQSGSGFVEQDGKIIPLKVGAIVLIDCYKPHKYYTKTGWEIYWIHFDGAQARPYYNVITESANVFTLQNTYHIERSLHKIFTAFHEHSKANEAVISKRITDLLTMLILHTSAVSVRDDQGGMTEDILAYISENADKPLSLEHLAKRASLSPFYFTRVFKKETGFTPHEYIIRARVDLAKFLLKTTDVPIKEIAFRSGFNSECSFCTVFKKSCGFTPKNYRDNE